MSRISNSGLRNQQQPSQEMLSFLSNFLVQNNNSNNNNILQYSTEQFFTFLQHLPLQQTTHLTIDERAQLQTNHRIMTSYLKQKLTQSNKKMTFTYIDLTNVLDRDLVDVKLLADICERQNREDVLSTIGAFIKESTDLNRDHQDIMTYLRTFIKPEY